MFKLLCNFSQKKKVSCESIFLNSFVFKKIIIMWQVLENFCYKILVEVEFSSS